MPDYLALPDPETTTSPTASPSPTAAPVVTTTAPAPTQEGPAPLAVDDKVIEDLVKGVDGLNRLLEGGETGTSEPTGPLTLDADQFAALGIGLALVVALLAALLIAVARR